MTVPRTVKAATSGDLTETTGGTRPMAPRRRIYWACVAGGTAILAGLLYFVPSVSGPLGTAAAVAAVVVALLESRRHASERRRDEPPDA
ncbi:hypothetical protein O1L60_18110 [Streptomyces diastatochromogenes]|nr:hypothetical protein [Streptomyces diastatochromogenes]